MSVIIPIDGYVLERTCNSFPEQYDVWKDGIMVGYLRLRHGYFNASVPDWDGSIVYEATPEGKGMFEDGERMHYLKEAVKAVAQARATNLEVIK